MGKPGRPSKKVTSKSIEYVNNATNTEDTPPNNQFEVSESSKAGAAVTRRELDEVAAGLTRQMDVANEAMMKKLETMFAMQAAMAKVTMSASRLKTAKTTGTEDTGSSSTSPNKGNSIQKVANPSHKGMKPPTHNHSGKVTP